MNVIFQRLEPVFLLGTRYENAEIRSKFVKLFEKDLPPSLFVRMMYVFGVQNWEPIGGSFWIR